MMILHYNPTIPKVKEGISRDVTFYKYHKAFLQDLLSKRATPAFCFLRPGFKPENPNCLIKSSSCWSSVQPSQLNIIIVRVAVILKYRKYDGLSLSAFSFLHEISNWEIISTQLHTTAYAFIQSIVFQNHLSR